MDSPDKTEHNVEMPESETRGRRPRSKGRGVASFHHSDIALPTPLMRMLNKYPSLQRHPHPFFVHFPIVFNFSSAFFSLVFLLTGETSFEISAFHCLGATMLTTPLAMLTGELSRLVNYSKEPKQAFLIERRYSRVLLALSSVAFLWRWLDPSILRIFRWTSLVYVVILLALPGLVTIISYFGGLLIFPLEKEER